MDRSFRLLNVESASRTAEAGLESEEMSRESIIHLLPAGDGPCMTRVFAGICRRLFALAPVSYKSAPAQLLQPRQPPSTTKITTTFPSSQHPLTRTQH